MDTNIFAEGMMAGPEGSLLRFFYDSEKNEVASTASGRAIFDTVLRVDVITPGQKNSTPRFEIERIFSDQSREALGEHLTSKRSYKYEELKQFVEKFKADEAAQDLGGTPLKMWPRIDRGLAATLIAANIYTVEALAAMSDSNLQYLGMGARELRAQAQEWLAQASGSADSSKLVGQVEELKVEKTRLEGDLVTANARINELERALADRQAALAAPAPTKAMSDLL